MFLRMWKVLLVRWGSFWVDRVGETEDRHLVGRLMIAKMVHQWEGFREGISELHEDGIVLGVFLLFVLYIYTALARCT